MSESVWHLFMSAAQVQQSTQSPDLIEREGKRDTYLNYSSEGEKKRLKSTLHLGYTDEQCDQARQLVFFPSQLLFPVCTLDEHDHQQMDNGELSFTYHVDWSTVIPVRTRTEEHKIWNSHWEPFQSRVLMLKQKKIVELIKKRERQRKEEKKSWDQLQ